jgi:hypothetical protein
VPAGGRPWHDALLRRKHDDLVLALEGKVEEHPRLLLTMQLPASK